MDNERQREQLKANDNVQALGDGRNILPLPPSESHKEFEMEIYARFMRHLRMVPNTRMEMKILSAIQFTADLLVEKEALVSKILVDLGLRAPRAAFPESYLDFIYEHSVPRKGQQWAKPSLSTKDLLLHWNQVDNGGGRRVARPQNLEENSYYYE
ncbi:MAG: hypothetical protein AAF549_03485 [Pseudomonadota bacterium]